VVLFDSSFTKPNDEVNVNDELERKCKEAAVALFKVPVPSQHFNIDLLVLALFKDPPGTLLAIIFTKIAFGRCICPVQITSTV
jgi:hypothetical protein